MIYVYYSSCTWLLLVSATGFILGGNWHWLGFIATSVLAIVGDAIFSPDRSEEKPGYPWVFNILLFASLPLLWFNTFVYLWYLAPVDVLGFGAAVNKFTGHDMLNARLTTSASNLVGGFLGLGLIIATAGTNVAHELVHRTWSPLSMIWGRWLLAFTCDTTFSIEHVYGHHRNIATFEDPASARRGENSWSFVVRSTIGSIVSAWRFEASRLQKRHLSLFSPQNRIITGTMMSVFYAVIFMLIVQSFWGGIILFLGLASYGKIYLEMINYIEHYGLVRAPNQPVEPRHSWNSNHRISTLFLYNLPRHSHHHAKGHLAFWKLKAYPEAPMLPYGYLTMIFIAAVPWVFHRLMQKKVQEWDERYATPEELAYLRKALEEGQISA